MYYTHSSLLEPFSTGNVYRYGMDKLIFFFKTLPVHAGASVHELLRTQWTQTPGYS